MKGLTRMTIFKCNHYTLFLLLLGLASLCWGQPDSPIVTLSGGLSAQGYQQILVYSGTNLTYRCIARSIQTSSTIAITGGTNANPVVFTATAHGLDYQSGATTTPAIQISGGTAGWAGVNGVFIATPTSANAFSIPVDSTGFGAFGAQALVVATLAPKLTSLYWAIAKFVYDGSNNLIWTGWATSTPVGILRGGGPDFSYACASRTTYAYQ